MQQKHDIKEIQFTIQKTKDKIIEITKEISNYESEIKALEERNEILEAITKFSDIDFVESELESNKDSLRNLTEKLIKHKADLDWFQSILGILGNL